MTTSSTPMGSAVYGVPDGGRSERSVPDQGRDGGSCFLLAFEAVAGLWLGRGCVAVLEAVDILDSPFPGPLDDVFLSVVV